MAVDHLADILIQFHLYQTAAMLFFIDRNLLRATEKCVET